MKINIRLKEMFSKMNQTQKEKKLRTFNSMGKENLCKQPPLQTTLAHKRTRSYLSPKSINSLTNNQRLKTQTQSKMQNVYQCFNKQNIKSKFIFNIFDDDKPKKKRVISKVPKLQSLIDEFRVIKVIGKGRFGRVVSAEHSPTGFICALKEIDISQMCDKLCERLISELKIQSYIQCQNCLPLYSFFINNKKLYLILELGETCLYDVLKRKKFLPQSMTALYIRQTINALLELHSKGIIHRDLKPENIVLVNGVAKLADFGWATYSPLQKRLTYCGTLDYISPEVIVGDQYSYYVDVWSVGILAYELSTGYAPFESRRGREETEKKIVQSSLKFPNHLSPLIKDFIERLLTKHPDDRMQLVDALEHPWLKLYQNYEY